METRCSSAYLTHFSRLFPAIGWFISCMYLSGCYEMYTEEPVGSLEVNYAISSNGTTCEAAGVEQIKGILDDGVSKYKVKTVCDRYAIHFEDIPEGIYTLKLYGINDKGITVVDSLGDRLLEVEILALETTAPAELITLKESPMEIHLRWQLGWGSCKSRNIDQFQVLAFDSSEKEVFKSSLACTTVGKGEEEYRIVPDKKRRLVSPDISNIQIIPLNKKKKSLGENFEITVPDIEVPGPGERIPISMYCDQLYCGLPQSTCNQ